ncbi:MAG: hypothetical protein NZ733_02075 [Aigarchaeota archaeon]|nr:hypothetical protein [Aigarchaeota archaeon]MDW8043466.1 hypothetical protein [Nitrososphaerota archaeon]
MRPLTLLVLAAVVVLVYAIGTGQMGIYYVVTESMEPSAPRGSLIIAVPDRFVEPGEMVLYDLKGFTVVHRASELRPEGVLVVADAYPWYSELVSWERVKGKAVLVVPFLGYVALGLSAVPMVLMGLLVVLLLPRKSQETESGSPVLFALSGGALAMVAAIGDTGLVTIGKVPALVLLASTLAAIRYLEVGRSDAPKWMIDASYVVFIVACLTSISRKAFLGVLGL